MESADRLILTTHLASATASQSQHYDFLAVQFDFSQNVFIFLSAEPITNAKPVRQGRLWRINSEDFMV